MTSAHVGVAIVGAGFAGLAMAIRLKQSGRDDFVIFERASEVGGTWRDNTYPGCACDVESPLYSFSFAPNPDWSRKFSPQPEIQAYLVGCAHRFGIRSHIRFQHDVIGAAWDDDARLWRIDTSRGAFTAAVLIAAMGPLSLPFTPDLPGMAEFGGAVFHSARWDHSIDLRDRNVAVIGTGASAVQFIPEIQPLVGRLSLFQRTPAWVVPRADRRFSAVERRAFKRFPRWQRFYRSAIYWVREAIGVGFRHPWLMRWLRRSAMRHLTRAVPSPELRAKLTPAYEIGCKRVLISNDYFPTLTRPNVEVVTEGIEKIVARGIVTTDGVIRDVDTIIFGTGFRVVDLPQVASVRGRAGQSLANAWADGAKAFLGTTIAGFPNLFLLLGPNTGLGHNSVVLMVEAQIEQVLAVLSFLRSGTATTIEPKPGVQAAYNDDLVRKTSGTVWVRGGCKSWYLGRDGYNGVLWPRSVVAFERRLRRFIPDDYVFT